MYVLRALQRSALDDDDEARCFVKLRTLKSVCVLLVLDVRKRRCYQDVSPVDAGLSGKTDAQPLVVALCITRLPAFRNICTHTHTHTHTRMHK